MLGREREGEREREVCVSRYLSVLWFPLSFSLFVLLSLSLSLSFSLSCFKTGFSVRRWCLIWQRSSNYQLDESFGFLPHTKYQNKTKQKTVEFSFRRFLPSEAIELNLLRLLHLQPRTQFLSITSFIGGKNFERDYRRRKCASH